MKAGYGKTVCPVCAADGGQLFTGRLLRPDSDEGPVMGLERRRWVIAADVGQLVRREEPFVQWKAAAFVRWHEPDDARVSCPDL